MKAEHREKKKISPEYMKNNVLEMITLKFDNFLKSRQPKILTG
jgi:hypothetical protein